ncbi:ISKra4 family transposase [Endomicrobium sp. AH-315-J14]|nr:ISKra4 family transposase [Endomicrobium sp. AH-315-J14]
MIQAYTKIAETNLFEAAREQARGMEVELQAPARLAATHGEVEAYVQHEGREFCRRMMQAHLELRAVLEQPVKAEGADGVVRAIRRESRRPLRVVFGDVFVPRMAYQAPGVVGLHPMDAVLNLPPERYSHGLRRRVAEEVARCSFDETVEQIVVTTGSSVPKRQVEQLAVRSARDFDAFYATRATTAEDTDDLLVLSFDGKGIAMRHEDLRPATQKAAKATPRKLASRVCKGEKRNRKRMAEVAAVYTIAPWERTAMDVVQSLRPLRDTSVPRPRPVSKRVWASIEKTTSEVISDAFDEALRRDPERRRRWVVLVDGNKDQLKQVKKAARKAGVEVTIVLDIIHVLEYLWKAAYCLHDEGSSEAQDWVELRFIDLLSGRSGGFVARTLRRHAEQRGLKPAPRAALDSAAKYLVKYTRLLHYQRALAAGLPIATGVIEGACRYLVKDRMNRTGARWGLEGAEAVLQLRALRTSGDFDAYWAFHLEREHERNHRSRYANSDVPCPLPPLNPRLRRVK